jgi:hypothetical protein
MLAAALAVYHAERLRTSPGACRLSALGPKDQEVEDLRSMVVYGRLVPLDLAVGNEK